MRKYRKTFQLVSILILLIIENVIVFMERYSYLSFKAVIVSLICCFATGFFFFIVIQFLTEDTVLEIYRVNLGIGVGLVVEFVFAIGSSDRYALKTFITDNRCLLEYVLCMFILGIIYSIYVILEGCTYYCNYFHITDVKDIIDNLGNLDVIDIFVNDDQYIGSFDCSDIKVTKKNNIVISDYVKVKIRYRDNLIRIYRNLNDNWILDSSNFVWHVNFRER